MICEAYLYGPYKDVDGRTDFDVLGYHPYSSMMGHDTATNYKIEANDLQDYVCEINDIFRSRPMIYPDFGYLPEPFLNAQPESERMYSNLDDTYKVYDGFGLSGQQITHWEGDNLYVWEYEDYDYYERGEKEYTLADENTKAENVVAVIRFGLKWIVSRRAMNVLKAWKDEEAQVVVDVTAEEDDPELPF